MLERTPQLPPRIEPLPVTIKRPLWSVMIPSYNCIHYLRDTIESVLKQAPSAEEMQIEVVDDYSTDADVEALVNELSNGRVSFYRQSKNVGSLRNFETCINRARGERIHILHGDDVVKPGFYDEIHGLFEEYSDIGAAFTRSRDFDENNNVLWESPEILKEPGIIDNWLFQIAEEQKLQTPSIVVKRSVYENLGAFFGVHYGEDWEMWTRIAAHYKVAYSPKPLAYYRVHNTNITSNSFVTGRNIKDMVHVINTIQNYLPPEHRSALKRKAKRKYAYYITVKAHQLHYINDSRSALLQVWKAFQLHGDQRTFYHLLNLSFKVLSGWKVNNR